MKIMKKNFFIRRFFLPWCFFSFPLFSQHLYRYDHCSSVQQYVAGDTVVIQCSAVTIMNQGMYDQYRTTSGKTNNPALKELVSSYESLIAGQDRMIEQQRNEYEQLKGELNRLLQYSNALTEKMTSRVEELDVALKNTTGHLEKVSEELTLTRKGLEGLRTIAPAKKWVWASGGFASGVAITLLLSVCL